MLIFSIQRGKPMKIIDVHTHLGNILYPNGRELIYQKGIVKKAVNDPQDLNERLLMRNFGLGKLIYRLTHNSTTRAQVVRGMTATLENMRQSMADNKVNYHVCMPIAPYLTFEDLLEASEQEPRIIPFTSIDFTRPHDIGAKLKQDVTRGARGLKLHPVIQCQSVRDAPTMEALQSFQHLRKPVLPHTGPSAYYLGSETDRNRPENGAVKEIIHMVRTFPKIPFIIGHAGLFWVHEIRKSLGDCQNVWVDTSFQSPGNIRKLIKTFGPEKVMYASDWPWGSQGPHIKTVQVACKGDQQLAERLFFQNAKELLELE